MQERGPVRRWLPLRLAVVAVVVGAAVLTALLVRQHEDPRSEDLVLHSYQGGPAGAEPAGDSAPGWVLGEDGRLAVYAAGSSSCPWTPTSVTAEGDLVTVRLETDDEGPCTADLVYTTHVVALPAGVDPGALEVELELAGRG
ncbi:MULTISPECIES: hypothetical protein [Isoptericola]|uniref:hypothetical protein n=1 Tax=Isoptericola TaxID=254250 RepID=UPI000F647360|nr:MULTISPECIES: hypothetical protein [Isoptericola]